MLRLLSSIFHTTIPHLILINFILLIILIYLNRSYIREFLSKIDKNTWLILVLIFLTALIIRVFVPPHQHIMYIDEAWYMEAGKDMLQTGYQGDYPKSIGWPFILTIFFRIFGISNWTALYTSTILGALTVFNIFFLAFIITNNKPISLASSLIFSLFASHIRWSASAETNIASLFFILLTMFFCFLYYKNKRTSLLWLALVSLAFTNQFRPENYTFPFLFLFGCILFNKKFLKNVNIRFILPWLVLLILSFADLVQILNFYTSTNWIEQHTNEATTGKNFGLDNFIYNSAMYGQYFINNKFQPLLFTIFLVAGLFYMFYKQRQEALFLLGWFCCILFVYSFSFPFIGGSTDVSAKTRYFMSFYPITTIFACYGFLLTRDIVPSNVRGIQIKKYVFPLLTVIVATLFIPYSSQANSMFSSSAFKLETKVPELAEKDIPDKCVILANWPTVLKSTTNLKVIDVEVFLHQASLREEIFNSTGCILFFEDVYCLFGLGDFEAQNRCKKIKKDYSLKPYKVYTEKNNKFIFYKLNPA